MNKDLEQIILDWISTGTVHAEYESEEYGEGYDNAISDLRSSAPELVDSLIIPLVTSWIRSAHETGYELGFELGKKHVTLNCVSIKSDGSISITA